MKPSYKTVKKGTRTDLLRATRVGARISVRKRLAEGQNGPAIRCEIIRQFREIFQDEELDDYECETLMAQVQRVIDEVLSKVIPCSY